MKRYVLDTSVVIKWFSEYDEDDLDKALALRQGVFEGVYSVIVPDLMLYELANALKYNPRLNAHEAALAVQSVLDMGFDVRMVEASVLERSIDIAFKFKVTVYDAYFLALAQMETGPLVTADYKLADRVKGFKHIMKLSEF